MLTCKITRVGLVVLLVMFFSNTNQTALAQQTTPNKSTVYLVERPLKDSILLRWAPSDYKTWMYGNKYGYIIERHTLLRNEVLLVNPEKEFLNIEPVKPWEMYAWEPLVQKNPKAAIAAQAIFGKTFDVDAGEGFTPYSAYQKSQEQQMRFAFALHAADMSPEVARASGLWYTDAKAMDNEKYLYRVYIPLPDTVKAKIDTGYVFTGISEYMPLPTPVEFKATFADKSCLLQWNILAQDKIYLAWEIERGDRKGRNYASITDEAIVPFKGQKQGQTPEYNFKIDSLPENGKDFSYRLRGITSFGEKGPWSDVIIGSGIESIKASPHIISHQAEEGKVQLKWEFLQDAEASITGFKVIRSSNHKTEYKEIASDLKPGNRTFIDKNPLAIGYYKIVAYRDSVAQKASFPYLVQVVDETPPQKPQGLKGTADTNGLITLTWQPNPDEDILGYRVFRSASNNDEYSMMTDQVILDTFYIDIVNNRDLNDAVYYKIVAYDQVYNQGEFSEMCQVIKPDFIPPSLPVVTKTVAVEKGILLEWINSSSPDVQNHVIYRKENDSAWKELKHIPYTNGKEQPSFEDTECTTGIVYQYMVTAKDEAMNESEPSYSIALKMLANKMADGLQKIQQQVDYENRKLWLTWKLPDQEIKYIKIYRKTTTQAYHVFETLEGAVTQFEDNKLKIGETYNYRIKLVYANGKVSGFSDELKIEF